MTLPTSGFYGNVMNSFFGNLTVDGRTAIWNDFLSKNNLLTNPPEDGDHEGVFMEFVGQNFQNLTTGSLSPDEIARRHVLFSVFDAIILLMKKLQDNLAVQTNLQVVYGDFQKAYTTMMARVPSYVGGSSQATKVPVPTASQLTTDDLKDFTLAYNNITVQEIIDFTASQTGTSMTTPLIISAGNIGAYSSNITGSLLERNQFFSFSPPGVPIPIPLALFNDGINPVVQPPPPGSFFPPGPTLGFNSIYPTLYSPNNTTTTLQLMASSKLPPDTNPFLPAYFATFIRLDNHDNLVYEVKAVQVPPNATPEQIAAAGAQAFVDLYKTIPVIAATHDGDPSINIQVPWPNNAPGGTSSGATQEALNRQAANKRNAQFIETIRSRRKSYQDSASTTRTNLDASNTAISGEVGILLQAIQQLRGILDKVFKK